jgi:hypothetical protein
MTCPTTLGPGNARRSSRKALRISAGRISDFIRVYSRPFAVEIFGFRGLGFRTSDPFPQSPIKKSTIHNNIMTHTGKIGRLSQARRDQLGHRLEDGCTGIEIVDWLNEQPDVRRVLTDHFGGRPITEQNLSDWRQSGHVEWVHREEARQAMANLAEQGDDVQDLIGARHLADEFALVVLAQIHRFSRLLLSDGGIWKRAGSGCARSTLPSKRQ